MGVVIVQSKSTAHIFRLFGALVALLLIMGLALGLTQSRGTKPAGSPYGGLASVTAPPAVDPGTVLARSVTPPAAPAAQQVPEAPPATPPRAEQAAAIDAAPASVPVAEPSAPRAQPRVIPLDSSTPAPAAVPVAPMPRPQAAPVAPPPAQVATPTPPVAAPVPAPVATPAEPARPAPTPTVAAAPIPPKTTDGVGLVNINTASAETLNHLPGVGRVGKAIVRHRPYRSLKDLVDHRVLRAGDFERIKSKITIE